MKIAIKRGNDRNLKVTVTREGAAVDITGWQVRFTVKKTASLADSAAIINTLVTSHENAAGGITNIPINATDTVTEDVGNYVFDIKVKDASNKLHSSSSGVFELVQEVTDEV